MGLLDYFRSKPPSPITRRALPRRRNYSGAHVGNLTAGWTTTNLTSTQTLKNDLEILRARSREQCENNPLLRRWNQLLKNNVVGPKGITMQARTKLPSGALDAAANDALEAGWMEWGRSVDMGGRLSWRDAQNLFISTVSNDGEALVQMLPQDDGFGFKIDFIDPQYISTAINEEGRGGSRIVMGVELDKWNRPLAYMLPDSEGIASDSYYWHYGRPYKRVPSSNIIHAFIPERVDQIRGVPWASNALLRMQMLDGAAEAELVRTRKEASESGTFEPALDVGGDLVPDGWDIDGEPILESEPGVDRILPPGWKYNPGNSTAPNPNFVGFSKAIIREIAASFGVSYFTLANDLEGVNYTSSRTGMLEDREAWKSLQEWTIEKFCRPIYEAWLPNALASGLLRLPANGPRLNPAWEPKYRNVSWQGPRWQWVDPAKEVSAWDNKITMGGGTVSQFLREQGFDPEEVFIERAAELARLKELGITTATAKGTTAPAQQGSGDDGS